MDLRKSSRMATALLVLGMAVLAGCAGGSTSAGSVAVRGELGYRERIALPPKAVASVEVRAFDADGARVVGSFRESLAGRQVPIPFALDAVRSRRHPAAVYELRASVADADRVLRASDPLLLDLTSSVAETGAIELRAWPQRDLGVAYACGDETLSVEFGDTGARLVAAGSGYELEPVPAASGARYQATSDETTSFHEKAGEAIAVVAGRQLAPCRKVEGPGWPFEARGSEPGWDVRVEAERVAVTTGYGARSFSLPNLGAEQRGLVTRVRAADAAQSAVVVAERHICRDLATGMPHPYEVKLFLRGTSVETPSSETFSGCGGRPIDLLTGRTWIVEQLGEAGLIDRSHITLAFDADGRVAGLASCNRYHAGFELTGESLAIGPAASTMMACDEALMRQEQRFLTMLAGVDRFDLDDRGALILHAGGSMLVARAEADEAE